MFLLANGAETCVLIFLGHYIEALKHHSGNKYQRLVVAVLLCSSRAALFIKSYKGHSTKSMCAIAVNGCRI